MKRLKLIKLAKFNRLREISYSHHGLRKTKRRNVIMSMRGKK